MKTRKLDIGNKNMVGQNIERMRKERGIKQKDFAALLGIKVSRLGNWERDEREFSFADACRMADILQCTLDELAGRSVPSKRLAHYADSRQEMLNINYESLDDAGKSAAFGAVAGIAAAYSRGETSQAWANDYQRRA